MTRLSTMHLKGMEDLRENKMEPQEIKKFPMELVSQDQSKLLYIFLQTRLAEVFFGMYYDIFSWKKRVF